MLKNIQSAMLKTMLLKFQSNLGNTISEIFVSVETNESSELDDKFGRAAYVQMDLALIQEKARELHTSLIEVSKYQLILDNRSFKKLLIPDNKCFKV